MIIHRSFAAFALLLGLGAAHAADMGGPTVIMAPAAPHVAASACAGAGVLGSIEGRFAAADRGVFHRGLVIKALANPRSSNHPFAEPGLIKRDFCMADSTLSDGTTRPVYYVIEHGLGFAGIGRSVDFCVLGLDPWHVHDGDCRTVR